MPMIDVSADEKDYTVAFVMTSKPVAQTWEQPAEGAEFEVHLVWNAAGKVVRGSKRDAVVDHALICYYDEMLAEAKEAGE